MSTTIIPNDGYQHERYSHLHFHYLQLLAKHGMVIGFSQAKGVIDVCEASLLGKQHHEAFEKNIARRE